MSIAMDLQDLRGYLRGFCLVVVVRETGHTPESADIKRVLQEEFALEIESCLNALTSFTGLDAAVLGSAIDELFHADDEFLLPDNVNLQLGLLSGRAMPCFPFAERDGVDEMALHRPFLDTARNLIHAAVRIRMQSPGLSSAHMFWEEIARFLRRMGGDNDLAAAIALSTVANVISDVLFFNSDAADRTEDRMLAETISHVLTELRTVNMATLLKR